jgi:hypothetical protein
LCRPSACQCPISDSRSVTQNSSYFCFQLFAALAYALVNVALHSRTVNFEQLIEEFLRIADDPTTQSHRQARDRTQAATAMQAQLLARLYGNGIVTWH